MYKCFQVRLEKYFFILLILNLSIKIRSQEFIPYSFPEKIPINYIFPCNEEYKLISSQKGLKIKKSVLKRFAETVSYGKQELFTNGLVYFNWMGTEDYLRKVVNLILPDSLKKRKEIKIYLSTQTSYNAYALHDGSILLNIGLLADVENEAALAFILGHELTHFVNNDVFNSFVRESKIYSRKNKNNNLELSISNAQYNRMEEKRADMQSLVFAEKGGYDLYYSISVFNLFNEEIEKKERKKIKIDFQNELNQMSKSKSLEFLLSSHPELSDRINYIDTYLKSKERTNQKAQYIIKDENSFKKLQQLARYETIHGLFLANNYRQLLEKAFTYHLYEPEDKVFLYYLLESIRRLVFINNDLKKVGFLVENDNNNSFEEGKGILHDLSFLITNPDKLNKIKAKELTNKSNLPFETYDEAFEYFKIKAMTLGINESRLTTALYYHDVPKMKDSLLSIYLKDPSGKQKVYAASMLGGNIFADLKTNSKKVVLAEDIIFVEELYSGIHHQVIKSGNKSTGYVNNLKVNLNSDVKTVIPISFLKRNNFDKLLKYQRFINLTRFIKPAEARNVKEYYASKISNKTDLFLLSPEAWQFIKTENLNSIEYLEFLAFDDKSSIAGNIGSAIFTAFISVIVFPPMIFYYLLDGSNRYYFKGNYFCYNLDKNKPFTYNKTSSRKFTKKRMNKFFKKSVKFKDESH